MKKCPYCGMSNSFATTICLNCWRNLGDVEDDPNLLPRPSPVMTGDPFLAASSRVANNVLTSKHDHSFRLSSILLAGIFLTLVLILAGAVELAVVAIIGTIVASGLFLALKRANRSL